MKMDLTLNQAIAEYFDIDGRTLPTFKSGKPVQEARDWLTENGHELQYNKRSLPTGDHGIVIYSRGGVPMFAVVDGDASESFRGAIVHGSIEKTAKNVKKSRKSSKNDENETSNDNTSDESEQS